MASILRKWSAERGEPANHLIVPSFILGDPWITISRAAVPIWTFFSVRSALQSLDHHLAHTEPYDRVELLMFQHGVYSAGIAEPGAWLDVVRRHGADGRLLALDPSRFPHDIATMGRYGAQLRRAIPAARNPWQPLAVGSALRELDTYDPITVALPV